MSFNSVFNTGQGRGNRRTYNPLPRTSHFVVQDAKSNQLPHYPFQPLPTPTGKPPYRFDLGQLLTAEEIGTITNSGVMVCHTVGDTGDHRGSQKDFVATMMNSDAESAPVKPAFFYHLGDVVYFAGDINMYGDNFYETYKEYPAFIVGITGNHDCQPDDPQDGPVDPNKKPFDGWVQNFMSTTPEVLGSFKTDAGRTLMDLPNVYWTFTTPVATFIGLCSNVGESQGEIHPDQVAWFEGELKAADPNLPLIVTVHHPPFSGDTDHSGASAVYQVLVDGFQKSGRYANLVLSGHVHNYQRFTHTLNGKEIPCVVAGAGGYTNLGKIQKVHGSYPTAPFVVSGDLTLEQYDHDNFGFMRLEITKSQIVGTYLSGPYPSSQTVGTVVDSFVIDVNNYTVRTQ
jgi:hypothetical protein